MQSVILGKNRFNPLNTNSDSNPTFKNGQILYGKINQLLPNQMAEVQIGNQKVLANLETPLQSGERYLFQVQQNLGNMLLKVLEATTEAKGKVSAKQILHHVGVAASPQATELAEFLLKNQLPITKDSFQLAMQWMKRADSPKDALIAVKTMYMHQLPFIEDVFKALFTQAKGESFYGMLQQLLENMNSANQTETVLQLKSIVESLIVPKQGQIQEMGLQRLISYWLNPNGQAYIKEGAFSLLQKTGLLTQLLAEVEGQSTGTNAEQKQLLLEYKSSMQNGSTINSSVNKGLLDVLLTYADQNNNQVRQAKDALTNQLALFSQNRTDGQLLPNERAVLQLLESESLRADLANSSVVSAQIKDITKALGLQLEHILANTQSLTSAQLKQELTTLKPLLLTLLQEIQPATVKELAEQIVNRITAQQLISQENGPLQNLLLTLPMNIGNYETDLTLQWSGRKRKDGSIDPDYCRILFYIDLEQLKETVIDMQVQNRVIKISVLNEQSEQIQAVAAGFIEPLRNQLEEINYKLSGVLFENTIKKDMLENKKQLVYQAASSYSGVDVRI